MRDEWVVYDTVNDQFYSYSGLGIFHVSRSDVCIGASYATVGEYLHRQSMSGWAAVVPRGSDGKLQWGFSVRGEDVVAEYIRNMP